jgi:hypothetical protein
MLHPTTPADTDQCRSDATCTAQPCLPGTAAPARRSPAYLAQRLLRLWPLDELPHVARGVLGEGDDGAAGLHRPGLTRDLHTQPTTAASQLSVCKAARDKISEKICC